MVLSQAEEEGYSVFCVRKATRGRKGDDTSMEGVGWEDGGVGILPESEADRLALVLGEPVSRTGASGPDSAMNVAGGCESSGQAQARRGADCLAGTRGPADTDQPTVDPHTTNLSPSPGPSDPFAESNDLGLPPTTPPSRRRRRQEDLDLQASPSASDPYAQFQPPRPPRNPLRTHSSPPPDVLDGQTGAFQYDDDEYDDAQEEIDDDENERGENGGRGRGETYDRIGAYRHEEENYGGPTDFQYTSRSYDDEDAALQAALKASMDDLPQGWVAPVWEEKKVQKQTAAIPTAVPAVVPSGGDTGRSGFEGEKGKTESVTGSKFKEELDEDDDDEPTEQLSAGKFGVFVGGNESLMVR